MQQSVCVVLAALVTVSVDSNTKKSPSLPGSQIITTGESVAQSKSTHSQKSKLKSKVFKYAK